LIKKLKQILVDSFSDEKIQNIRYDFFRYGHKNLDFATTAIHGIDTVRFITNSDYRYIHFYYQEMAHLGMNVANFYMECIMVSGARAQLNFCPVSGVVIERATVNLYDNTFFLNIPMWSAYDTPGRLTYVQKGNDVLDLIGNEVSNGDEMFETCGFFDEDAIFFDTLKAGKRPKDDLESALQSVEIADCIRNRYPEYYCEK